MGTTINFIDRPIKDFQELKVALVDGKLKYTIKDNLPQNADRNIFIYTTDTQELYHGLGEGLPIRKVSDVKIYENIGAFPKIGHQERLFVDKRSKITYYWDGEKYEQQSQGGVSELGQLFEIVNNMEKNMMFTNFIENTRTVLCIEENTFNLLYYPIAKTIRVIVNGITYNNEYFKYNKDKNNIVWNEVKAGFHLEEDDEITLMYDFLYYENGIFNIQEFLTNLRGGTAN